MKMTEVDRALEHADLIASHHHHNAACDQCEDECYTVEVRASFKMGEEWHTDYVFRRDHLPLWEAMAALGRWLMGAAGRAKQRDNARWLLEHQGQLW